MSLQTSPAQGTQDCVVDLRSIDLSGIESRRIEPSLEDGFTLSLLHLDVALAVSAEDRDVSDADGISRFKVSARRLAHGTVNHQVSAAEARSEDPVIQRLSDALAAAETAPGPHADICADALRLALLTRQFSRQFDAGRPAAGADEDAIGRNVKSLQKWRLKRVLQYVDERLDTKIVLQDLATVAGLSRMHFAAQFRAAMGMRPHEYLLKRRIERAAELLKQAEASLVDVALTVGFQTQAHFTTVFKRFTGDTPHQWRSAYHAQSTPLPAARGSLS